VRWRGGHNTLHIRRPRVVWTAPVEGTLRMPGVVHEAIHSGFVARTLYPMGGMED
jgi:hypothetical protein